MISLRKALFVMVLLGLALITPGRSDTSVAYASSAISWTTPFVIQNIDTKNAQDVQVAFYDTNGNLVHTLDLGSLAAGAAIPVRPQRTLADGFNLPAGQQLSVVVSADAKISAITNMSSGYMQGSYAGEQSWKSTGTSINFPNVVRAYASWNSPITVQNAGSAATTATITFKGFNTGLQAAQVVSPVLQPGQAYTVDPMNVSGLANGTQYSVVATSNYGQPLAGMCTQILNGNQLAMSYSAQPSPASTTSGNSVYMPNIVRNYYGVNSPFIVQNVGTQATNITAYYYRFSDGSLAGQDGPYNLGVGLAHPFRPQQTSFLSDGTQYSVTVVSESAPVVALVNESSASAAMSYSGLSVGGTTITAPNITRNYYGWNTPAVVQNVGNAPAQMSVTYYSFTTGQAVLTDGPYTVQPNMSHPFRPWSTNGLPDGQYSVVVTSTQPAVAVINEANPSTDSMAYEGQTP